MIAGRVDLTVDFRDLNPATLDTLFATIARLAAEIAAATKTRFTIRTTQRMPSGAGHDAQSMARIAPMAMIFVPSVGGISHAPQEYTGFLGIHDEHALEAALARPEQKAHCEPNPDLATLAAAYAFGLAKAHPFNDGNKRTSFFTAMIFLGLNGKELDATEEEVVQAMTALAAGSLTEAAFAKWIRERLVRLKL